ncbi:MAG TPA: right-handed parallel beta-helix repeat-containing protein [Paludibacteraceae bacterium]|nr:right-handed parallel beta-helix repeat-containing protein [Paludibacteraceae bacterium]HRS68287.1 right-handed parallel beta-helix repeat-containing protein [Paludibacteraceae bacterium]
MKTKFAFLYITVCFISFLTPSCVDEQFTTDPSAVLSFSCDTLSFDTVFTNVPSRTVSFFIYNKNDKALKITSARLAKGSESYFRFNLDGRIPPSTNFLQNIEIKAKDSLFVFVELTVDPNDSDFPVFYKDSMVFVTNGQTQDVKLITYGQDAIVFNGKSLTENTTLTAVRPYLIFNYLHIVEGKTLTLEPGARLFFHDKANLIIDGNLISDGTLEKPVVMRTDRFDRLPDVDKTPYDYMPGQWGGVYLQNSKGSHLLNHTFIRGCNLGVVIVGTHAEKPTLTVKNSVLHSMTQYGLYAQNAKVIVENTEISNCGTSCLYLLGGESYVVHSTLANYYMWGQRKSETLVISNYILDGNLLYLYPVTSSVIENSIVFGNQSKEILLHKDTFTNAMYNVLISNTLIKSKRLDDAEFHNITWARSQNTTAQGVADTVFVNTSIDKIAETGYYNFQLDAKSIARSKANTAVAGRYPIDLLGKSRLRDGAPDLGAYEK